MNTLEVAKDMLSFIDASPTAFHAAANAEKLVKEAGFERLRLLTEKKLEAGKGYYFMQNGSALLAVKIPENSPKGFRIVASHSDAPCFKIKETPEIRLEGHYTKLNTEKYGGMIMHTWMDRPLSAAGRVFVKNKENGAMEQHLVNFEKDMLMIPSVAIHFDREVNNGQKLNPQVDLLPLFAEDQELTLAVLL